MNFLELIRKKAYWMTDYLKGANVFQNLKDLKIILDNHHLSLTNEKKEKYLTSMLQHANLTTEFYKNIKNSEELYNFPVTNKNLIKENIYQFLSNQYQQNTIIPVVTSGSTGTPFKVYHDRNKKLRNNADTLFFAGKAGYEIGQRLIYMKIWAKQKMTSPFHYKTQNVVPVDVIQLSKDQIKALIIQMESYSGVHSILGYVSAMEEVCKYLDKAGKEKVDTQVASIITMSETLNDYTRSAMEKYFGSPVFSRYSNLENGIIAQQIPGSGTKYLVNTASYFVEILQMDKDEPAKVGEKGRIIVTDLFNFAMPMIRYGNTYLDVVEGRKLDLLYDTKGELVSSYIVYKNMWQYTEINQYQLIQEGEKEYLFKISMEGSFGKEDKLVGEFKQYLGQDAVFSLEYVQEIPLLDSGKRRKIVNNYRKN